MESQKFRYNAYPRALRNRFGTRVRRACIDPGLSCPNLDGTISSAGCLFCNRKSFTPTAGMASLSVREQVSFEPTLQKKSFFSFNQGGIYQGYCTLSGVSIALHSNPTSRGRRSSAIFASSAMDGAKATKYQINRELAHPA